MSLKGKTLFITGASRGIGLAIALKAARDGANIVIAAKTDRPHPNLPGTIYTAADEIRAAGGRCLPCVVDVRFPEQIQAAIDAAVKEFGGIDILINNASAINITGTADTTLKKYDLMNQVNARGTWLCSKLCLPHLQKGSNPHILNISPPLDMRAKWFAPCVAYTISKFGMSMCVLGMAEEFREHGIAVNALWPQTAIATAATNWMGGQEFLEQCRKPEIMADSAYAILTKNSREFTGNFVIDEDILRAEGMTQAELDRYAVKPGAKLALDFFVDGENEVDTNEALPWKDLQKKSKL